MNAINSNIGSLNAQHALRRNLLAINNSLEKLSTGQRINRGADDPAGLITSENLRAVLAALDAEVQVSQRADHVIATADGALGEISNLLVDAESLIVANANSAGMSDAEREANQMELSSIISTVNRMAGSTTFNGDRLLDGSATINAGGTAGSISINAISADSINIANGDLSIAQNALHALQSQVVTQRGELGAFSRHAIGSHMQSTSVAIENIASAESQIRDTDYAIETANLIRWQVLAKTSQASLALAMTRPANVLNLIA